MVEYFYLLVVTVQIRPGNSWLPFEHTFFVLINVDKPHNILDVYYKIIIYNDYMKDSGR